MSRFDRVSELHRVLAVRRTPIGIAELLDRLECSESTARRAINTLRNTLGAPLVYDRRNKGWRYDLLTGDRPFELPGLWFNASELYALLAAHQLLSGVDPGLLADDINPLTARIEHLLAERGLPPAQRRRVRLRPTGTRAVHQPAFGTVCEAVLGRRRLAFAYRPRGPGERRQRHVSPQRLTWYRGNWYLEAWCEEAGALRRFAVERIEHPRVEDQRARETPAADLDSWSDSAYGIFAGPPTATAVLRFTPNQARWVADEQWHPDQQSRWLDDGRYELQVPYADPRELLMDILRYGPDVEVVAPEDLRAEAHRRLAAGAAIYEKESAIGEPAWSGFDKAGVENGGGAERRTT